MRTPEPPPLPEDLEALLRHLRLPHIRRLLQTCSPRPRQTLEPPEVLKALLQRSSPDGALRTCDTTKGSELPRGKTSRPGTKALSHPGTYPASASDTPVGAAPGEPRGLPPVGTGKSFSSEAIGQAAVGVGIRSPGRPRRPRRARARSPSRRHVTRAVGRTCPSQLIVVESDVELAMSLDAAKDPSVSSMPPTKALDRRQFDLHPVHFDEPCRSTHGRRRSTASCTMPMSASQQVTACGSSKLRAGRG